MGISVVGVPWSTLGAVVAGEAGKAAVGAGKASLLLLVPVVGHIASVAVGWAGRIGSGWIGSWWVGLSWWVGTSRGHGPSVSPALSFELIKSISALTLTKPPLRVRFHIASITEAIISKSITQTRSSFFVKSRFAITSTSIPNTIFHTST